MGKSVEELEAEIRQLRELNEILSMEVTELARECDEAADSIIELENENRDLRHELVMLKGGYPEVPDEDDDE